MSRSMSRLLIGLSVVAAVVVCVCLTTVNRHEEPDVISMTNPDAATGTEDMHFQEALAETQPRQHQLRDPRKSDHDVPGSQVAAQPDPSGREDIDKIAPTASALTITDEHRAVLIQTLPGLYSSHPREILGTLGSLPWASLRAHLFRLLELSGHPDVAVRAQAIGVLGNFANDPRVREWLFERYVLEASERPKLMIVSAWLGGGETFDAEWEQSTRFLKQIWDAESDPRWKWEILAAYCGLGHVFPREAVAILEQMLAAGFPSQEVPDAQLQNLREIAQKIVADGQKPETFDPSFLNTDPFPGARER